MKLLRIMRLVSVIISLFITGHLSAAEINHVIDISPDMVKLSLIEQDLIEYGIEDKSIDPNDEIDICEEDVKPYMSYKHKARSAESEHEYIPLLEEGKTWWYNYKVVLNLIGADVHDRDVMLKLEGKKEIDGKEYFVLNFYIDGVFEATAGYLYEDIENRQVYVKCEDHKPEIICDSWFYTVDGLLYDFNDPDMPIVSQCFRRDIDPVEVEIKNTTYFGWKNGDGEYPPLVALEGLGLLPYNDDMDNVPKDAETPTLVGFVDQIAGGTLNIYPYIYKITDKEGNVLFETKEYELGSQSASMIDKKISAKAEGNTILIDNPSATRVNVINASGMQIYQSSNTNIRLDVSPGLYMVIGDNNATKLIVK